MLPYYGCMICSLNSLKKGGYIGDYIVDHSGAYPGA